MALEAFARRAAAPGEPFSVAVVAAAAARVEDEACDAAAAVYRRVAREGVAALDGAAAPRAGGGWPARVVDATPRLRALLAALHARPGADAEREALAAALAAVRA
jgi:hypothetical protein